MSSRTFGLLLIVAATSTASAQHNPGSNCFTCHSSYKMAGTVFADSSGVTVRSGIPVSLTGETGNSVVLEGTNANGNIASPIVPDGNYLITVGNITSRTWHIIPGQGSCNSCHVVGGNGSTTRTKRFPRLHTRIPKDNNCAHCHHFPATMAYPELMTSGVLNTASIPPAVPGSQVDFGGVIYPFDSTYTVTTRRPDIFAPGYFSMFDVILAVAQRHNIPVEFHFDSTRMTHFITKFNNVPGDYWYRWSYDAGSGNQQEIQYRRANRWDELLWRPGVWIKMVLGEDVAGIKAEYLEEINREKTFGHMIPSVRITINPSNYQGNPPGSGRISVTRNFSNVQVTPHNMRSVGYPSPYPKPFQPGVVTSMDIPLSLVDQSLLTAATGVFYTNFGGHFIHSYYIVELGFPGVGVAHSSGRHGIVYTTENGTYNQLPNNADSKFHVTSDIAVLHAPDFSQWRWIELGNPYYEPNPPTGVTDPMIDEDFGSIARGFNLHPPYPNPFNGAARITFNIFEPGDVQITVVNSLGQQVITLFDGGVDNIGVHEVRWEPGSISTGPYYVVMRYEGKMQVRNLAYVK